MNTQHLSASRIGLNLSALLGARSAGAPLPSRLLLFKMGTNETSQGPFIVTEESLANLAAVQRSIGRERCPIGFNHNLDEGSPAYLSSHEPRPTAARGATVLGVPGKGIVLDDIAWTQLGADTIGNYEDLSPTPLYNKETRVVHGILSASLVHTGAIYDLTLDASAAMAQLSAILPSMVDNGLTRLDRTVAAFARENQAREQREARLRAARPVLDPSLTGRERVLAANQAANEANPDWQRTFAPNR